MKVLITKDVCRENLIVHIYGNGIMTGVDAIIRNTLIE